MSDDHSPENCPTCEVQSTCTLASAIAFKPIELSPEKQAELELRRAAMQAKIAAQASAPAQPRFTLTRTQ